jgi:hypothetical protein
MQSFAGEHFGMPGARELFKRWKRAFLVGQGRAGYPLLKPAC